jgi:hypothetical protein
MVSKKDQNEITAKAKLPQSMKNVSNFHGIA